MSSLIQHRGQVDNRGVELFICLVKEVPWIVGDLKMTKVEDAEPVEIPGVKGTQPKLYRIWRKPVDMIGCWVRFRINGKIEAPDLSTPIGLFKLPRDADPLTEEEARQYWTG